ncbi:hypothetical protein KC19_2G048700 [Ceratodon purpureus]|uniref:Uncharacterized protein n=1 Tax=Ceratodon purpureus TaxID=3225 RepID=A0A8T0IS47_CERPU|nr:hypothetical protein KC19_2G048700 [Ceratodon purpureus]
MNVGLIGRKLQELAGLLPEHAWRLGREKNSSSKVHRRNNLLPFTSLLQTARKNCSINLGKWLPQQCKFV